MFKNQIILLPSITHGTGGSSLAKMLKKVFGDDSIIVSGGEIMRAEAARRNQTMEEFAKALLLEDSKETDVYVDTLMVQQISHAHRQGKVVIIDSTIPEYLCNLAEIPVEQRLVVNLTCDPIIAATRAFNSKSDNGIVRIGDTVCKTPEELAQKFSDRVENDQARYLKYYNFSMLGQADNPDALTLDTTSLTKMEVLQSVASAFFKANRKKIIPVVGRSQVGKDTTVHFVSMQMGTKTIDTGIFYRMAHRIHGRTDGEISDGQLSEIESEIGKCSFSYNPNIQRFLLTHPDFSDDLRLYNELQDPDFSKGVPSTSSIQSVRTIVGIAQIKAAYIALKDSGYVFVVGRDPYKIFPGFQPVWFCNSDPREIAIRGLNSQGLILTEAAIMQRMQENDERNLADTNRAHGSFGQTDEMLVFDSKGYSIDQQRIAFVHFLKQNYVGV